VADSKVLDCQFGAKYFKQRSLKGETLLAPKHLEDRVSSPCGSEVVHSLYPDFAVSKDEKEGLSMRRLRCLQEEQITSLKTSWLKVSL